MTWRTRSCWTSSPSSRAWAVRMTCTACCRGSAIGSPGLSPPLACALWNLWPQGTCLASAPWSWKWGDSMLQATGWMWPCLPVLFFKNRNNYFKKNSFNKFHSDMHFTGFAFLKTYQKEKKMGKKKLDIYQTSFQLSSPPNRQPVPFCPSSEQLTQLRISFLQDEVPFWMLF